jgi:Zn-dependent peptidase ImmA (M78 family)
MSKSPEIRVNPELLIWARESSGIEIPEVAKRFKIRDEVVESWERGEKPITYLRLESLADFYQRPLAALFLPHAPADFATPTDFRTSGKNIKITREIRHAVRRSRLIRNTFFEINENYKKFERKKITIQNDPEKIAKSERENLGITFEVQRKWGVGREAFNNWIKILEENGIIILQMGFPIDELNGFSLGDGEKAPVIVINSRDVFPRKIFTLFHEYCHLLLDANGICKLKIDSKEFQKETSIESFCDKFASAFLVPDNILLERPEINLVKNKEEGDKAIKRLADMFKVNRQVILLRLFLKNHISRDFYDDKKKQYDREFIGILKKKKEAEKKSPGGPPPHIMAVSQNGKLFTRTVLSAYRQGRISNKEISTYLGVKLQHIPNIESII